MTKKDDNKYNYSQSSGNGNKMFTSHVGFPAL